MPGTSPLKQLWLQILIATPVGVALGHFAPTTGADMKPLGDAFIALIRMMIGPAIFGTVVHGGAGMDDMKRVGRAAAQAARLVRSDDDAGARSRARHRRDAEARRRHEHRPATDLETAKQQSVNGYLLHIIPTTVFSALSGSEVAWKRRIDKTDRTIDRGFLEGAWRKNMFWMLRISVISSC